VVPLLSLGLIIAAVVVFSKRRGRQRRGYNYEMFPGAPSEHGGGGGVDMQVQGITSTPTQNCFCDKCGFELSQGFCDRFCPSCGVKV